MAHPRVNLIYLVEWVLVSVSIHMMWKVYNFPCQPGSVNILSARPDTGEPCKTSSYVAGIYYSVPTMLIERKLELP